MAASNADLDELLDGEKVLRATCAPLQRILSRFRLALLMLCCRSA